MSDFYVGYLPKAPAALARFVRKAILGLGVLGVVLALVFVFGQEPFANSSFEYGKVRNFEGTVAARPYPTLLVARPGQTEPEEGSSRYLLVAPGKHGADDLVADFDGQQVRLQGQLIYREGGTMVEVMPGSIVAINPTPGGDKNTIELGVKTVTGEIVDSKCFLGVMNPGKGKVHRDCAARCLSGGIPPIFLTDDGEQLLLVDPEGRAFGRDALREFIAEPIAVRGELVQRGGSRMLKIDPRVLRHTPEGVQAIVGRATEQQ